MYKKIIKDIDSIESRQELIGLIGKYKLNITNKTKTLKELKKDIKEALQELQSQLASDDVELKVDEKKVEFEKHSKNTKESNDDKKTIKNEIIEEQKNTHIEIDNINLEKIELKNGEENDLEISNLELYRDADITIENKFELLSPVELLPIAYLRNNSGGIICNNMKLVEDGCKIYITAKKEDINFNRLEKNSCEVIVFDKNKNVGYTFRIKFELKNFEIFKGTLCIDFGTSNTAIGTFLPKEDRIFLVKFRDVLNNGVERDTIPTIVYVENCENPNDIKYKFGYEAKKAIKDRDYNFGNTIFYEIKKWLLNPNKIEKIVDDNLNQLEIPRKDIIKAYLEYIIGEAVNQLKVKFEKIHFSTPINLKGKYINSLRTILPEYNILSENKSIDEGVAVIYDEIYDNIIKNKKNEKASELREDKKVLTIDVGGGTTDVVSFNYSLEKDERGTLLKIKIFPENSNTSFGGNNITYRIFQFLKIKIAKYFNENIFPDDINIDSLINMDKPDILQSIDENNSTEAVYCNFENLYKEAAKMLPTNFNSNKDFNTNKSKKLLKRNFYLLWEVAEIIKIEFFKQNDIYLIDFIDENKENKKIKIPGIDKLFFSVVFDGKLQKSDKIPEISIGINEIQKLIYGDIYKIIKDICDKKKDITTSYKKVKLSGQTCNIILFQELLKEYIAGKLLRIKSNNKEGLKLNCIKGSIKYTYHIDSGVIIPEIKRENMELKYKVKIERFDEEEILTKEKMNIQIFDKEASTMKLNIYDFEDRLVKTEIHNFNTLNKCGNIYTLDEIYNNISKNNLKIFERTKEELSNVNPESKIAVFCPLNDGYTFQVIEFIKDSSNNFNFISCENYTFDKNFDETKFFNGDE